MSRWSGSDSIPFNIFLGLLLGVVLVSQVGDKIIPQKDLQLTPVKHADALTIVSAFCDRVDLHPDSNNTSLTRVQHIEAAGLVWEVCNATSFQLNWLGERPAEQQAASTEIPL
ncbi:MAG: hypothetical protein ACR2QT_02325 [Woeseiaceae bacterium]